ADFPSSRSAVRSEARAVAVSLGTPPASLPSFGSPVSGAAAGVDTPRSMTNFQVPSRCFRQTVENWPKSFSPFAESSYGPVVQPRSPERAMEAKVGCQTRRTAGLGWELSHSLAGTAPGRKMTASSDTLARNDALMPWASDSFAKARSVATRRSKSACRPDGAGWARTPPETRAKPTVRHIVGTDALRIRISLSSPASLPQGRTRRLRRACAAGSLG